MNDTKSVPVWFNGEEYKSTLEGRIAAFLTDGEVDFTYEDDRYETAGAPSYYPDFWVQDVYIGGSHSRSKYVRIEGKPYFRGDDDEKRVTGFSHVYQALLGLGEIEHPVFLINNIPKGDTPKEIYANIERYASKPLDIVSEENNDLVNGSSPICYPYNTIMLNGKYGPAAMCIRRGGGLYLGNIMDSCVDIPKTLHAYRKAREEKFLAKPNDIPVGFYEGNYKFTVTSADYTDKKICYGQPGMKLKFSINYGNEIYEVHDNFAFDSHLWWKFDDFCTSIGYSPSDEVRNKDHDLWTACINRSGWAHFRIANKKRFHGIEVPVYWPENGDRPKCTAMEVDLFWPDWKRQYEEMALNYG